MSTILAIETSTELASAALLCGDRLTMQQSPGVQTHSDSILPMVQLLLAQAGISMADCDAIAFGSGPGSFTGVRTACGVTQGLAFGSGRPVVCVVTLQAMAQACLDKSGQRDVLAILDARMGEVYWAQYRFDRQWQTIVAPTLSLPSQVQPHGSVTACGNGLQVYGQAFAGQAFVVGGMPEIMPHAAQIAQLARQAFERGETVAAQEAQPLYLRNKVALTTEERLAKAARAAA